MTTPNHPFVMFPSRIWNLPSMTIQLLKFYEKIFQFWHQGHECFLSNKVLMEYSGMKSDSTCREAFTYFEKHGEMKRILKGGKRYILPPTPRVSTEGFEEKQAADGELSTEGSAVALGGERCSAGGGSAVALDNNIKIIIKDNNKSFCKDEQKKDNLVDNSSSKGKWKSKADWRKENNIKPAWAENKIQMANEQKHADQNEIYKRSGAAAHIQNFIKTGEMDGLFEKDAPL
ncbi:MAG TPA: hypothetical protein VHT72_04130 [Puia sp.]|nr:hypothetical protein [Puia sp.]